MVFLGKQINAFVMQTANRSTPTPVSSAEVGRLLASDPAAAEARTREILSVQPQNVDALLVLGAALGRQGKAAEARAILEPIVAAQPDQVFAQVELGIALAALGDHDAALDTLARAVDLAPTYVNAWCALAGELPSGPSRAGDMATLRAADEAIAQKRFADAETLLVTALEGAPDFDGARLRQAIVHLSQEKAHLALPVIEELMHRDPGNPLYSELYASALQEAGSFHKAIAAYEKLLGDGRERPGAWMSCGRALRAIGREEECVAAFWKAVEILPEFAQAWRTLATLKTIRFPPATINRLRELLARPHLLISTRMQLHFALARALEDAGHYGEAFENYTLSQTLQGTGVAGTAARFHNFVGHLKTVFTAEFFRSRGNVGCAARGPVFVVGMPRAGSTLVQEILAAHSAIERTGELHDLNLMVNRMRGEAQRERASHYPALLATLPSARFCAMGEEYLEFTRPRRKTGKPFFVDKHPENFVHAGLIRLVLPQAKIIDARRNPLDCCFSVFRNYFPSAPPWSHDLEEIGRYYAAYVELMAHWDAVMPNRVHRVIYEDLVADPEREVRRLLDYLELPFEESCLRFYEKEQAIETTSVDQARQPIYAGGVHNSGKFDPWLGPLKKSLGSVLDAYPRVPKFDAPLKMSFSMRIT